MVMTVDRISNRKLEKDVIDCWYQKVKMGHQINFTDNLVFRYSCLFLTCIHFSFLYCIFIDNLKDLNTSQSCEVKCHLNIYPSSKCLP